MSQITPPLARLIDAFQKLPGIGSKSAQRLAFFILRNPKKIAMELSEALIEAKDQIKFCSICANLSAVDPCEMCSNPKRDSKVICVVADTRDMLAIEKTGEFFGSYHIIQGLISPMEGVGPEQLKIKELVLRLQQSLSPDNDNEAVNELIFAINPSVEGEATTLYLSKLLRPLDIKMTRIAFGLPIGGDLEYADHLTLSKALEGRRVI